MPQRYYKSSLIKLHTSWATQTQFCYEWFYTVKSKLFNHLFWMTNLGKTAFYYTSMQLLAWFCILVFVHYSSILTESKQQNYPLSHPLHWDIWQNAVSLNFPPQFVHCPIGIFLFHDSAHKLLQQKTLITTWTSINESLMQFRETGMSYG